MPPKDNDVIPAPITETVHTGIAAEARKLADTEGITVAAAVEKLSKKAVASDGR